MEEELDKDQLLKTYMMENCSNWYNLLRVHMKYSEIFFKIQADDNKCLGESTERWNIYNNS